MKCADLKPGDKALLEWPTGYNKQDRVEETTVLKVYKNGLIVVEGVDFKFRPTGSPAGERQGFRDYRPHLSPLDADKLAAYRLWQEKEYKATQLVTLGQRWGRIAARDVDAAARIWDALPEELRTLDPQDKKG